MICSYVDSLHHLTFVPQLGCGEENSFLIIYVVSDNVVNLTQRLILIEGLKGLA